MSVSESVEPVGLLQAKSVEKTVRAPRTCRRRICMKLLLHLKYLLKPLSLVPVPLQRNSRIVRLGFKPGPTGCADDYSEHEFRFECSAVHVQRGLVYGPRSACASTQIHHHVRTNKYET